MSVKKYESWKSFSNFGVFVLWNTASCLVEHVWCITGCTTDFASRTINSERNSKIRPVRVIEMSSKNYCENFLWRHVTKKQTKKKRIKLSTRAVVSRYFVKFRKVEQEWNTMGNTTFKTDHKHWSSSDFVLKDKLIRALKKREAKMRSMAAEPRFPRIKWASHGSPHGRGHHVRLSSFRALAKTLLKKHTDEISAVRPLRRGLTKFTLAIPETNKKHTLDIGMRKSWLSWIESTAKKSNHNQI